MNSGRNFGLSHHLPLDKSPPIFVAWYVRLAVVALTTAIVTSAGIGIYLLMKGLGA